MEQWCMSPGVPRKRLVFQGVYIPENEPQMKGMNAD